MAATVAESPASPARPPAGPVATAEGARAQASDARIDPRVALAQAGPARRRRRRPGCGGYCRQAGGFGGGAPGKPKVVIPRQTVRASRDGVVVLRARCRLALSRCQGAVLLNADSTGALLELGRADLNLPGHNRRATLSIALSAQGQRVLRRHHRVSAFATADVRRKGAWSSGRLTVLAAR